MMRAVKPTLIRVLMTLQAIVVHHHRACGYEIARGRSRKRRMKIIRALRGTDLIPFARIVRMERDHTGHDDPHRSSPGDSDFPFDARAGKAVQYVKPYRQQGC